MGLPPFTPPPFVRGAPPPFPFGPPPTGLIPPPTVGGFPPLNHALPPFLPPSSPFTPPPHMRPTVGTPPPTPISPTIISKAPQPPASQQQADVGFKFPTLVDRKTNVFVGKISPHVEDEFIQKLLRTCGLFDSWKRLKDDKTKLWKPFGFCEFSSVESAMIALNVLNGMKLEGTALELKMDSKATQFMEEFKQKKLELIAKKRLGLKPDDNVPVEITDADREQNNHDLEIKIQNTKQLIAQLFSEQENIKVELENRQSISEEMAVQNTIEKIAATGAPPEETETKRVIIADQIRKFRELEKKRERERVEKMEGEKRRRQQYEDDKYSRDRGDNQYNRYSPSREYGRDYKRRRYDYQPQRNGDRRSELDREYNDSEIANEQRPPEPDRGLPVPQSYTSRSPPIESKMEEQPTINLNLQPITLQTKKVVEQKKEEADVDNVFGHDEEDDDEIYTRKRKLTNLDEIEKEKQAEEDEKKRKDDELKRRVAEYERKRRILSSLPENKDQLFSYPIDWSIVDQYNIAATLKDFVNQLIIDVLGGEEVSMTEFILGKVELHCTPSDLLQDLGDVLGEDAESFMIKLWRELLTQINQHKP